MCAENETGGDTFSLLKSLDDDRLPEHAVRNYFARLVDGEWLDDHRTL